MIKMRMNTNPDCYCSSCTKTRRTTLVMYDIGIIDQFNKPNVITLCEQCMEEMFRKSLKMIVAEQQRLKSRNEIQKENAIKSGRIKEISK